MSDLDKKEKVQRGQNAQRITSDPVFQDAIQAMRDTIHDNMETSHWNNDDEMKELYRMLRTIRSFEQQFTNMINSGKKAESRIEE